MVCFLDDGKQDLVAFASSKELLGLSGAMSIDAELLWVDVDSFYMLRFLVDDELVNVNLCLSRPFGPVLGAVLGQDSSGGRAAPLSVSSGTAGYVESVWVQRWVWPIF